MNRLIKKRRNNPLCQSEEGGSLVEFALVLPLLMLVLTGIITFGITLCNYIVLTEAVGVAARQLAISRGQTTDPCATTSAVVYAAAPTMTKASFTFSFTLNGTAYSGASCSSASTSTGAAGNLVQGAPAQVVVTYPCSLKVWGTNYASSCTLTAQTTELVQ